MQLDGRIVRLIAVGASVAANCQPCLQTNAKKAAEAGAGSREIAEAVAIGRMVREGSASKMDRFISTMADIEAALQVITADCGCGAQGAARE